MHNALPVKVIQSQSELGDPEANHLLGHEAHSIQMKAQVAPEHEVEHHEEVLVVLKGISQVTNIRRIDLFQ
jgi:hypothetical protein